MRRVRLSLLVPILLAAVMPATAQSTDPAGRFQRLEAQLAAAAEVRLVFHVTSEGAFASDLRGQLELRRGRFARLRATGHFGGQPVELRLRRDGNEFSYGNGEAGGEGAAPAELDDALLVGLTRMGILHNLAMLTAGAPPDHGDGGVREWVVVDDFELIGERAAIGFDLTVDGVPSGSASLTLDSAGMPVVRHQTVAFPEGEMLVVERYAEITIEGGESMGDVREFAERYTAAWNSGDPAQVAWFFAADGSLKVNDAEPAEGREAIAAVAEGFMTAFPDMELTMDGLHRVEDRVHYHWTFAGTNTGPDGTGKRVRFSGYENWRLNADGLVQESLGNFDAEEYARQLEYGVDAIPEGER